MLPNSNETAKSKDKQDVYIKSNNFSLLNNKIRRHTRSQSSSSSSATSEEANTFQSFNLDKNTRGWIVEPSNINAITGVQPTPSRSLDNRKQQRQQQQQKLSVVPASTNTNLKKPTMVGISQKDILGAVSDEDIFKLTELTSRLPEVTTSASNKPKRNHSRRRPEHDGKIALNRNHSSSQDIMNPVTQKVIISQAGIINSTSSSPTSINNSSSRNSSDILLDNTTSESNSDTKRRSWLYKSLIKPKKKTIASNKSKSTSSSEEQPQETIIPEKSPAASIVEEFYNRQSLENSFEYMAPVPITRESSSNNSSAKKLSIPSLPRIHSFNIGSSSSDVLKNKLKSKRLSGIRNNNNHTRSNSSHVTGESSNTSSMNRRHSFDSFHSLLVHKNDDSDEDLDIEQDNGLLKWDQDRRRSTFNYAQEEEPTFNLVVSEDNIHNEIKHDLDPYFVEVHENYNSEIEKEANNTGSSTPINYIDEDEADKEEKKDDLVTLMFDYLTLPTEVKALIDLYEQKGKVERKRMVIKHNGRKNSPKEFEDDEDDEDEDDDEEDEENIDNVVNFKDIISGQCLHKRRSLGKDVRDISIVTTARSDYTEFTKLVQIGIDGDNGPLLDLHVSFDQYEETEEDGDLRETIQSVEKSLESFQAFKKESSAFLRDYMNTTDLYNHQKDIIPSLSRTHSYPNLSADKPASSNSSLSSSTSSSDGQANNLRPVREMMALREAYSRNTQSMYANNAEIKSRDPFERRQKEIFTLVNHLKTELQKFKDSLQKTESLVNDVQNDMVDTRNRMDTYIKDIPETHYSALKKLEVDIESILSNRAKNPWLDTGYALLSYLLTLFALVVWIVIYILKWGKKVVLFPRNLWRAYKDYLEERNKVVRNASMMSVAGTGNVTSSSSSIIPPQDASLFQRPTSNRLPSRRA